MLVFGSCGWSGFYLKPFIYITQNSRFHCTTEVRRCVGVSGVNRLDCWGLSVFASNNQRLMDVWWNNQWFFTYRNDLDRITHLKTTTTKKMTVHRFFLMMIHVTWSSQWCLFPFTLPHSKNRAPVAISCPFHMHWSLHWSWSYWAPRQPPTRWWCMDMHGHVAWSGLFKPEKWTRLTWNRKDPSPMLVLPIIIPSLVDKRGTFLKDTARFVSSTSNPVIVHWLLLFDGPGPFSTNATNPFVATLHAMQTSAYLSSS